MRRPGLWTIVGLLIAAAAIVGAILSALHASALQIWDPGLRRAQQTTAVAAGAALGGLVLAGLNWLVYRKRRALMAGEDLLARWRVGMFDWAAFRRRDTARDGLFPSLRNRMRLPAELPPGGMEIRVGPNAILAGDACYGLGLGFMPGRGRLIALDLVAGPPAMLEFTFWVAGKGERLLVFRFPVPDNARAEAQKLIDHFARTLDAKRSAKALARFPLHVHAARGDAGEAEAARTEDKRRNWRGAGFALLFTGAAMLAASALGMGGPNGNLGWFRLFTIGGGLVAGAGVLALLYSRLRR